ncbi:MAG: flavodoxin family protein [Oscillospiraceae bacterium]|jgi:multimeric flavodoxin WrbA|nr:flavodoxin family protein [Oscillospiraceae bacterium]
MKTLIINGSPRRNGDTAALIAQLRRHLSGEIAEVSAYYAKITPCIDCRACWKRRGCAISDDMNIIYADDFDAIVLATPVYFSDVPGPVRSLMSRFQWTHAARHGLREPAVFRPKKAGVILAAGGKGNADGALRPARILLNILNAAGVEDHTVISANTDDLPAAGDTTALAGVRNLAEWLEKPL